MDSSAILAIAKASVTGSAVHAGVLEERREAFDHIYEKKLWGKGESASGEGSWKANAVGAVVAVTDAIQQTQAGSLLDCGCGDLNWIRGALQGMRIDVLAVDITPAACSTPPSEIAFQTLDIVTEVPAAHDLVLCRQCLNHMCVSDAVAALHNIRASGSKWLLVTHYTRGSNASLPGREAGVTYRAYNLAEAPFTDALVGEPMLLYDDEYNTAAKEQNPMSLALWRLV